MYWHTLQSDIHVNHIIKNCSKRSQV